MHEMATEDDITLSDSQVNQIRVAREYFSENSSVPPIRTFAKVVGVDKKILFKEWLTGPMKQSRSMEECPNQQVACKITASFLRVFC